MESNRIYSFQSCPCVLELSAQYALLRNYKGGYHPHLVVPPGIEGVALPGLQVKAIHWNMRFVWNYRKLYDPQIRQQIVDAGGIRVCCCWSPAKARLPIMWRLHLQAMGGVRQDRQASMLPTLRFQMEVMLTHLCPNLLSFCCCFLLLFVGVRIRVSSSVRCFACSDACLI